MRKSGKMASHNELGKEGENAAVKYLLEKGYEIRHRNWHSGHRQPEDAVDRRKIRSIVASTDAYVRKFAIDLPVRFDIITVVGNRPPFHIAHIEDAFFPPVWN